MNTLNITPNDEYPIFRKYPNLEILLPDLYSSNNSYCKNCLQFMSDVLVLAEEQGKNVYFLSKNDDPEPEEAIAYLTSYTDEPNTFYVYIDTNELVENNRLPAICHELGHTFLRLNMVWSNKDHISHHFPKITNEEKDFFNDFFNELTNLIDHKIIINLFNKKNISNELFFKILNTDFKYPKWHNKVLDAMYLSSMYNILESKQEEITSFLELDNYLKNWFDFFNNFYMQINEDIDNKNPDKFYINFLHQFCKKHFNRVSL